VVEPFDFVRYLARSEASLFLPVVDELLEHVIRTCETSAAHKPSEHIAIGEGQGAPSLASFRKTPKMDTAAC